MLSEQGQLRVCLGVEDDTYWMLQDDVIQLQWRQELSEPMKKAKEKLGIN